MNEPTYRKIKIDIDYGGMIRHFEIDNEDFLKQYYKLQSNWNNLRETIKDLGIDYLLDKMNELEGKDKDGK